MIDGELAGAGGIRIFAVEDGALGIEDGEVAEGSGETSLELGDECLGSGEGCLGLEEDDALGDAEGAGSGVSEGEGGQGRGRERGEWHSRNRMTGIVVGSSPWRPIRRGKVPA